MEQTDIFGFPCIGEEDYAGVPIYMKDLAQQIEAGLSTQQDALEEFMDVGSAIWQANLVQVFPDGFSTPVTSIDTQSGGAGLPQLIVGTPSLPPLRGWYYIGGSITLDSVGAYTPASVRVFTVTATTIGLTYGTSQIGQASSRAVAIPTPPGNAMWCGATVFHDGLSSAIVQAAVYHNQVANDLTSTLTPNPRIFVVYLGDSPEIQEVS